MPWHPILGTFHFLRSGRLPACGFLPQRSDLDANPSVVFGSHPVGWTTMVCLMEFWFYCLPSLDCPRRSEMHLLSQGFGGTRRFNGLHSILFHFDSAPRQISPISGPFGLIPQFQMIHGAD